MSDVQKTIIVVLVAGDTLTRQVTVINPDFGGVLDLDEILALGWVVHLEIAEDDVGLFFDAKATSSET